MPNDVERRSAKATRKSGRTRRDYRVDVRFGDTELDVLDERRGTVSRSAYIRKAALYGSPKMASTVVVHNEDARKLAVEVNKIGVNVNQMARALNKANVGGFEMIKVLLSTRDEVSTLQKSVDELSQKVDDLRHDMENDLADKKFELEEDIRYWSEEIAKLEGGGADVDY